MNDLEYIKQLLGELEDQYCRQVTGGKLRWYFCRITDEIRKYAEMYHENLEELGLEKGFSEIPLGDQSIVELENEFKFRYKGLKWKDE